MEGEHEGRDCFFSCSTRMISSFSQTTGVHFLRLRYFITYNYFFMRWQAGLFYGKLCKNTHADASY